MIHLTKSKTGFQIIITAKNGEPLVTSEVLKSKQGAWRNVTALSKIVGEIHVQDDIAGTVWRVRPWYKSKTTIPPVPRYIPGKNKK